MKVEDTHVEEPQGENPETPETPAPEKESKKRFLEAVADKATAMDNKIQTKKEQKAQRKAEKQQAKGEHATRNKLLKIGAIAGGVLLIGGKILMDHAAAQSGADYVDDGSATQMLPESTGEDAQAEPATDNTPDEIETIVGEEVTM